MDPMLQTMIHTPREDKLREEANAALEAVSALPIPRPCGCDWNQDCTRNQLLWGALKIAYNQAWVTGNWESYQEARIRFWKHFQVPE